MATPSAGTRKAPWIIGGAVLLALLGTGCSAASSGSSTDGSTSSTVAGSQPVEGGAVKEADPTIWVVAGPGSDGGASGDVQELVPIDPVTGTARTAVPVSSVSGTSMIGINPAETTAYLVEGSASGSGATEIVPLALTTGETGSTTTLQSVSSTGISSMAFSPDGDSAYLANAFGGDLVPVNLESGTVEQSIPLGNMEGCGDIASHVVVTPDGGDAYVVSLAGLEDVDLATGKSSPPFDTQPQSDSNGSWPTIALTPDGSKLDVLGSGRTSDTIDPVNTDGDSGEQPITVPVGPRAPVIGPGTPTSDAIFDATDTEALVVTYDSVPEQIIPVNLSTGVAGTGINLSSIKAPNDCAETDPVAVGITPDGTDAVVGVPGSSSVNVIDLSSGVIGPDISVGVGQHVLGLVAGAGWPNDWWAASLP